MLKFKILTILIFSFIIVKKGWSTTEVQDSTHSFNSFNLLKLKNHWLNSGNIAGMTFNSYKKIGIVNGGYELTDGEYHLIRKATHKSNLSLFSESYQIIKNMHFYGKFRYKNSNETGNLWTGVFDPYRGNPYVIGDSISDANIHKESFVLSGGIAKKLTSKITFGLLAEYFVGVSAKQKDPRPKSTITNFSFTPSLILHLTKSKLGVDIGYRNRKESISFKQVVIDNPDPSYFMFKGMGFYSYETTQNKYRFYSSNNIYAGMQYETTLYKYLSLTEIRGLFGIETIDDGSNTIKREDAGDWKTYKIELNQQLTKQNNSSIHKITFNGYFFNGDGIEYTQKSVLNDDNASEYVTLSKNLKLNRKIFNTSLAFEYLKLIQSNKINWSSSVFTRFNITDETYYYIPEIFNAGFSNIEIGIDYEKNLYFGNIHFAPKIAVKYQYNLSKEMNLSNDETITKRQTKELYIHDYNYNTAHQINYSAILNCGYKLTQSNKIDELFWKIGYQYFHVFDSVDSNAILTAKIGFMF